METEAETPRAVYDCPHCGRSLEATPGRWNGWRLCPDCGRAGPPPEARPRRVEKENDVLMHGIVGLGKNKPDLRPHTFILSTPAAAPTPAGKPPRIRIARVAAASVLGISLFLLAVTYEDGAFVSGCIGVAAIASLCVLVGLERRG